MKHTILCFALLTAVPLFSMGDTQRVLIDINEDLSNIPVPQKSLIYGHTEARKCTPQRAGTIFAGTLTGMAFGTMTNLGIIVGCKCFLYSTFFPCIAAGGVIGGILACTLKEDWRSGIGSDDDSSDD